MKKIIQATFVMALVVAVSGNSFASAKERVRAGTDGVYQAIKVSGRVTSGEEGVGNGDPLPGVNVTIRGTTFGTVTDASGEYSLEVLSSESVLVFTFIGYMPVEVKVGQQSSISPVLMPDITTLSEVVVVGYGEQRKATVTGAMTSVSGEDLVRSPVSGVSNALIGLGSGIQAIQTTGEFGADKADIRIRGIATLNTAGASPIVVVDGVQRDNYNNIDPNEIESITILKDASSTAVFGVQGANGVIVIKTKQGKIGKPTVNFTGNWAALQPSILPKLLNSYDYARLRNEAEVNMGRTPTFSDEDIRLYQTGEDPVFHPDKNWIDELIKPFSFQQTYNMNISGGTEKLRYFTSLGYLNQSGGYHKPEQGFGFPFKHSYDRYNVRMNFDFDLTEDFFLSIKIGDQITDNSVPNGGAWGAFDKATNSSPMSSPGFIDGKYISEVRGFPAGVPHYNPWAQPGSTSTGGAFVTQSFGNTLNTNLLLKYRLDKLTEGLSVRVMGAYDSHYEKVATRVKLFPSYTVMKDPNNPDNTIIYRNSDDGPYSSVSEGIAANKKWRKMYGEAAFEYARLFDNTHRVGGLFLTNISKAHYPHMPYGLPTVYMGFVGRATYDYKGRYLAEFNMGYNGSENFPEGNRFGFFPAFSAGWVVTEESFMPVTNGLSFLKIRGSYGEVGNDKIGDERFLYIENPFALGNGGYQAAVFGQAGVDYARYQMYKEGLLGNPNVTWERAKKWNIGAEVKFINDKLSVTADYFEEHRDNILWTLGSVPEIVAATLPKINLGEVENYGFEVETAFNDKAGDLTYWVKGAYSFARNEIKFSDEPEPAYEWMRRTGQPVSQYFGLQFEGFYNSLEEINDPSRPKGWNNAVLQPGDMKYKDLNQDGAITAEDMAPIGYSNWPEITYSFSFGATWKGFDFSMMFQGTDNVSVRFSDKAAYPFTADWGPAFEWNLERWNAERYANGDPISFPRLELNPGNQHNYQVSDFWVQDGSYIRLKNAELGYRFSPGLLTKAGVASMRVYVSGNNLVTWTNMKYRMDPDARELWGRTYPPMRVFNAGVNFQF